MRYTTLFLSIFAFFILRSSTLDNTSTEISFELLDQKPVVHVMLNGKPVTFLLDTGSDLTLIDIAAAKSFGIQLRDLPGRSRQVEGIGSKTQRIQLATGVDLNMAGHQIFTSFAGIRLSGANAYFTTRGKTPLVGIIGADVMQAYGFVIDYEKNRVLFR